MSNKRRASQTSLVNLAELDTSEGEKAEEDVHVTESVDTTDDWTDTECSSSASSISPAVQGTFSSSESIKGISGVAQNSFFSRVAGIFTLGIDYSSR